MANLSQQKRQRMLEFLQTIREEHKDDDDVLIAIGEIESELNAKKYGLVWEQHEEAVDVQMRDNIPVFTECADKEIFAAPGEKFNFLLEGDNLHSLRLLEKTHLGKIDLIYIDPPYNTGNQDFRYDDVYVDELDTYRHSKWLSFMSERLRIAAKLLAPHGFIFISMKWQTLILKSKSRSEVNGSQLLPELPTRAARICFPSMTRSTKTTGKRKVWSTRKSCCRPMPRRNTPTGNSSGTQWKPLKTSGTPSLPDGLCWHCPEKCRRNCIPRWCRTTATSFLFPKA